MACITAITVQGVVRVNVIGRLTAADTGPLEHACAPALLAEAARLEIDLRGVTAADRTAAALIARMIARGAHVHPW
jgi:hypothetical protein